MEKVFLLSYPRSGNTWTRYIIEAVTKRQSAGYGGKHDKALAKRTEIKGVDSDLAPVVYKSHKYHNNEECDGIICIVRDYKECAIRHGIAEPGNRTREEKIKRKFDTGFRGRQPDVDYIDVLMSFDEFEKPKLLVYYEDLLTQPKVEIERIAKFLGANTEDVDEFMDNYDTHVQKGVKAYHDKSYSKGNDLKYHQKKASAEICEYMTSTLEEKFPELFDKYLSRYK